MNLTFEELDSQFQELEFNILEEELIKLLNIEKVNEDILRTLGLYRNNKYNNAAALLADHNNLKGIDIVKFGSDINELMDREVFENISIISVFNKTLNMYKKYYQYEKIDGALRVKKEKIPEKAFRESIANTLIHRL